MANSMNVLKDHDGLKSIVDKELITLMDFTNVKINLSDNIFLHKDEEKRACYPQI